MPDKCIGFFTNPNRSGVLKALQPAMEAAVKAGCTICVDSELKELSEFNRYPTFEDAHLDLIAAFGGDGTILRAASAAVEESVPVLGVNLGRKGFLSEITADGFEEAIARFFRGEYLTDKRMMLECSVNGGKEHLCLNDVLLYKKSFSGIIDISVTIDGIDAGTVFCDGLIISTPTGATGYSISAGGPVIAPGLNAAIITPICPHTLCFRPIIVPENSDMSFVMKSGGYISLDGIITADISKDDCISVHKSEKYVGFVRYEPRNIYSLIRKKLS